MQDGESGLLLGRRPVQYNVASGVVELRQVRPLLRYGEENAPEIWQYGFGKLACLCQRDEGGTPASVKL
jgi:hypothetical protein